MLIDDAQQPGGFIGSGRFARLRSVISRFRRKRIHEDRVPDVVSPVTEGVRCPGYVGYKASAMDTPCTHFCRMRSAKRRSIEGAPTA